MGSLDSVEYLIVNGTGQSAACLGRMACGGTGRCMLRRCRPCGPAVWTPYFGSVMLCGDAKRWMVEGERTSHACGPPALIDGEH